MDDNKQMVGKLKSQRGKDKVTKRKKYREVDIEWMRLRVRERK